MKRKLFLIALLGCLTFSQALSIPVYAAAVTNPTDAGGSDGTGGGGGYVGGNAGTYIPKIEEIRFKSFSDYGLSGWRNITMYKNGSRVYPEWAAGVSHYLYNMGGVTTRYYKDNDGKWHENYSYSQSYIIVNNHTFWPLPQNANSSNASFYSMILSNTEKAYLSGNIAGNAVESMSWNANGETIFGEPYKAVVQEEKAEKSAGGTNNYCKQNILTTYPIINGTEKDATGNGIVKLTAINANVASGQENTSYINNIKMTDKISPDEIILSYLQEANKTTVNWKKPESNGTEYEFKVQVYRVDYTAENGLVLEQDSEFM